MEITPEHVLDLQEATADFLCPITANTYCIDFVYFRIRDLDTNQVLVEVARDEDEESKEETVKAEEEIPDQPPASRTIRYHFGPDFLQLRNIGTTLEFTIGDQPVTNFRMIERHYFRNTLL
jgi:hypothetical protein